MSPVRLVRPEHPHIRRTANGTRATVRPASGPQGPRGLPGVNAVANDAATGINIATPGTDSQEAVDARIAAAGPFVKPGPTVNTGEILQGIAGYNPDGSDLPNFNVPPVVGFSTGGIYTDPDTTDSNIFHGAFYAYNNTVGAAPTVAVMGFGKGDRAFGGNFIGYTDGHGIAQGVEVDYGNVGATTTTSTGSQVLPVTTFNVTTTAGAPTEGIIVVSGKYARYTGKTSTSFTGVTWEVGGTGTISAGTTVTYSLPGTATGVTIVSIGSNIGGAPPGVFLQMQSQVASQGSHGVNFNSSSRPAVQPSGTLVRAPGERCATGIGFAGSQFSSAGAFFPVNSGSTTSSVGVVIQAEGGFANAGSMLDMRAAGSGSSATNGLVFRVSGGIQPISGALIKVIGSLSAANGVDFTTATFSGAAIALGDGHNVSVGTTTGTKLGTSASQKLGFYGATPVVKPVALPANATDLATAITLLNYIKNSVLVAEGLAA